MTPAQKAFEKLQDGEWVGDEGIEEIRKALRGVAKSQGLLSALKLARIDVNVGRGRDWIIKDMDRAINNFNSDETGVGL